MYIEMIDIESSNIKAIGFKENVIYQNGFQPKNVLRIEFLEGGTWDYLGVEKETYDTMMLQKSKGSFWWKKIKDKYHQVKVND